MLTEPTVQRLEALRLHGLRTAWDQQQRQAEMATLAFDDRLALLEVVEDRHGSRSTIVTSQLMSTEFLGKRNLCAESKALASVGVDPRSDEFRQDGVDVATQEKMREGVSQGQRGDHF